RGPILAWHRASGPWSSWDMSPSETPLEPADMATVLWLSADPVVEAALGVTDRSEGVRYLIRQGHDVTLVCGARRQDRPIPGVPSVFLPARYVPLLGWIWIWPRLLRALRSRAGAADV